MELLLVGTVHRDPAGKKRLLDLLLETQPAAISLEVSPASVRLRQKWGRSWIKIFKNNLNTISRETGSTPGRLMAHAAWRGVFEYLRLPYEYRAAAIYAQQAGKPLFLLDDSKLAVSFLSRVENEIISEKNLRLLNQARRNNNLSEEVAAEYSKAQGRIFTQGPAIGPQTSDPETWTKREAELAQRLRLLHQGLVRRSGQSLKGSDLIHGLIISPEAVDFMPNMVSLEKGAPHLYIGGWEHLVEDEAGECLYARLKDFKPERRLCHRVLSS